MCRRRRRIEAGIVRGLLLGALGALGAAACSGEEGYAGGGGGALGGTGEAAGAPGGGGEAARVPGGALQARGVRPGVEVLLSDSLSLVRGRRVGLITNHTGRDRSGTPSIDLLAGHAEVELVALYSPEHGIRGSAEAGVRIAGGIDERTGLPVHSLYGDATKPTDEMLDGIEVLLFDIQDVGTRYYTYLSTMALAMEAAGERGIPFVVLDRPNPIGGERVQGNILDPEYSSFVGLYPIPMRHGLTAGEFARLAVGEFGVRVDLSVVVADGWERTMRFAETGIPWIAPRPTCRRWRARCTIRGRVCSRARRFRWGAGRIARSSSWARRGWTKRSWRRGWRRLGVPDARFVPVRFTPESPGDGKFGGVEVGGVRLEADGPAYDPTLAALAVLVEARAMSGDDWSWRGRALRPARGHRRAAERRGRWGVLWCGGGRVGGRAGGLSGSSRAVPALWE